MSEETFIRHCSPTLAGIKTGNLFAFSFFTYTAHWWTDTEGSLAAVEEMPAGYADKMVTVIENIPALIVALILTVPAAIIGMRIAERVMKKQAAILTKRKRDLK